MKQSRFLTKDDFGMNGKLVTIRGDVIYTNVAKEDEAEEFKYLLFFEEFEKGMVLNVINQSVIAMVTGSDDTENWNGKKIVVFNDPTVVMKGKLTGGIRVRAPRNRPAQPGTLPAQSAPRHPAAARPYNTAQRAPAPAAPEPSDNDGFLGDEIDNIP